MMKISSVSKAAAILLLTSVSLFAAEPYELVLFEGESEWASSEFTETIRGKSVTYSVLNVLDQNPMTCWVEAAEGNGIGEYIGFEVREPVESLVITNGFARSAGLFEKNGRVKTFKVIPVLAVTAPGLVSETDARLFFAYEASPAREISLDDTREKQEIAMPWTHDEQEDFILESMESFVDDFPQFSEMITREFKETYGDDASGYFYDFMRMNYVLYCLKLEIAEVYPGSRYEDTCLTDVLVRVY